ncbi:S-adenosyl-L-methionine-dependent methyltransferase [Fomitiporia mediterranea MF3/22]|uniref:S-adenosyl-L-methionine-dependent methyltransferase n=1 Tax=Fomitiporia mediterranea (strain MF3/22) TaxID=694068 RepID=UPI0004408EDA|nr:S-adenosyl-L-methionine-dependent methyltransferase [Fomitiporia mediterranea MF3/22]EJD02755.1 S-adenosyl-L-methionine-dependent methyltransferase [Fomitiporia mediterranea MF3/22]
MSKLLERAAYDAVDRGLIPDFLLRIAIQTLLRHRLRMIDHGSFSANQAAKQAFVEDLCKRPAIAEQTDRANAQHYEVSTKFILSCLGPRAKYSSCLYPTGKESLAEAEELILASYSDKARLKDGQDVLDLGCGWGSLTLYLAERYPSSRIVGLSNSNTQREHILGIAKEKGLENVEIITADVNTFDFTDGRTFDRILSIEMFEHMKNYKELLQKISRWMRPKAPSKLDSDIKDNNTNGAEDDESLLFVHYFCHKTNPYHFEEDDGWMAQTFFSGGTMMSSDLLLYFQSDVTLVRNWFLNGKHYSRSLEAWLRLQDANAKSGIAELEQDAKAKGLDPAEGRKAFHRFRLFYMACSELFGFNDGEEWGVAHYLFKRKS